MFLSLIRRLASNDFKQLSNRNLFKSKLNVQYTFGLDRRKLCDKSGDDKWELFNVFRVKFDNQNICSNLNCS